MVEQRAQRRLAAILAADVVGYGRLMHADETGTVTALKSRRFEILEPAVSKHRGRIVKVMGDGVLVEFASAVNAVDCAVELQAAMDAANVNVSEDRRIVLRVGINLGDVIVEGSDLYGDGVNIAARLEALAEPGTVLVSQTVFSHVQGKVQYAFQDLGEQNLKNIAETVRVYGVSATPTPIVGSATRKAARPPRPSIAVLPFTNMSGNPEQQYLSDGITEDIITELSRYRELLVIARNSSFQYRDKSIDMKRLGRELGVEYLVEGSLRKAGNRLRITAQLIEATTGSHIWAEHYDRSLEDVFAIQDEVTQTITVTLAGRVATSRTEKSRRKPTHLWAAYDCFLQAIERTNRYDTVGAVALLNQAIQLNSDYAQAYAMLAFAHIFKFYADYREETLNAALSYAETALSIDNNDGLSQAVMGSVQTNLSHWDLASMHFKRAVSLNPNSVLFASLFAHWLMRVGRTREALQNLDIALQRDPLQPPWYWELRSMALLVERRYEEAIQAVNHTNPLQSWNHGALAIAHAYVGRDSEARREAAIAVTSSQTFRLPDGQRLIHIAIQRILNTSSQA